MKNVVDEHMKKLNLNRKPGQNDKNKFDCYVSSHQFLKWCREITQKAEEARQAKIRAAAEARSAMHAKRNAKRAERKRLYAQAAVKK